MTSNEETHKEYSKRWCAAELPDEPKTPHEEVMFCIESTNDIVSKILEILEKPRIPMPTISLNMDMNKLMKYVGAKKE